MLVSENEATCCPDAERKKEDNPYNFTEEQLQRKKLDLEKMKVLYPRASTYWASMVWDMVESKTEEELEAIKQKVLNEPTKHIIPTILESHDVEVLTPEEAEAKPLGKADESYLKAIENMGFEPLNKKIE